MFHYHIIWGAITGKDPSILNFTDREEALSKFEEIGRAVEEAEKFPNLPNTATKSEPDRDSIVIKIETLQTRICFVYCNHKDCDHEIPSPAALN